MAELDHLHNLLNHEYGLYAASLSPIHLFENTEHGVYRVDLTDRPSLVLRVYQQEGSAAQWLKGGAATLLYLEKENFPAPRLKRTKNGALIGFHKGWSALLLTYLPGEMVTGAKAELRQIGALLAQLHNLKLASATRAHPPIPPCRWQPNQKIANWLAELHQAHSTVPQNLCGLYEFSVDILSQVGQWTEMPLALLHADPNPFNAICTTPNELTLIDWDGAGIGPAILDLGYLLLTIHILLPPWPMIDANADLIEAIMHSYCSVRLLTERERQALPTAVSFNDAVWAAQAIPQVIDGDWRQNRTLHRFGARYPSLARIGEIAQQCCQI